MERLDTSQTKESSFSEYFRVLRAEAEDYLSAKKPQASSHVRILSEPHSALEQTIAELKAENVELKQTIATLESENRKLKCELREEYIIQYAERLSRSLTRFSKSSPSVRICEVIEDAHLSDSLAPLFLGDLSPSESLVPPSPNCFCALDTQKMNLKQFPGQCFERCKQELTGETSARTVPVGLNTIESDPEIEGFWLNHLMSDRVSQEEKLYCRLKQLEEEVRNHKEFIKKLRSALERMIGGNAGSKTMQSLRSWIPG